MKNFRLHWISSELNLAKKAYCARYSYEPLSTLTYSFLILYIAYDMCSSACDIYCGYWSCWDKLFSHSHYGKNIFKVKHGNMRFENSNFSWPSDSEGVIKETDFVQPQVPHFYFFHSGMQL